MNKNPTGLTVVIPTKDRPFRLHHAIQSVLPQLVAGDSIVIVDDGSTPAVETSMQEFLKDSADNLISFLRNEVSQGPAMARNTGVSVASTPYIVFLDDDDALAEGYLDSLRKYWMGPGSRDYGYALAFNDRLGVKTASFQPLPPIPSRSHLFPLSLGVWVKRATFEGVGGLRPDLVTNEDTEFGINLVRHGFQGVLFEGAGVVINATRELENSETKGQASSITKTMRSSIRAQCFNLILEHHASYLNTPAAIALRSFCIRRMLELSAKAKVPFFIPAAIERDLSIVQRLKWKALYIANRGFRAMSSSSKGN